MQNKDLDLIISKDFRKKKIKEIYRENDAVVEEKRDIFSQEAKLEADWAKYHAEMVREMEDAEKLKQRMVAEENRIHREILAHQKEELNRRKAEMKNARLPEIGTDFFKRFGQSCR